MNPKSLRRRNAVIHRISGLYKKNIPEPDKGAMFDIYEKYTMHTDLTEEELDTFHKRLDDVLVKDFRNWVEPRLADRSIHIDAIEDMVHNQPFTDLRPLLWSLVDLWSLTYKGPVASLAEIVTNPQNVHAHEVLKSTTDGILRLRQVEVPAGQKTLKEIAEAFMIYPEFDSSKEIMTFFSMNVDLFMQLPLSLREEIDSEFLDIRKEFDEEIREHEDCLQEVDLERLQEYFTLYDSCAKKRKYHLLSIPTLAAKLEFLAENWYKFSEMLLVALRTEYFARHYARKTAVEKTIADMRNWGNRESVMKKGENVYKTTLRGAWAKIKASPESKELINRLWEECSDAVDLCADGHVGRLCNVFVGFDDAFANSLSPMEYFQNNIALISESAAPLDIRIEQAKKLMDDMNMPEEDRAPWLDALS